MKGDSNDGMTYREALAIGTKADGAIKCTFATIYADPEGKQPLFSLQRDKTNYNWLYKNKNQLEFVQGENGELIPQSSTFQLANGLYFYDGESRYGGADGWLYEIEIPIVRVDGIENSRCVPATLLSDALDLIKKAIANVKKRTLYKVWLVSDPGSPGYPSRNVAWQDIVAPDKKQWQDTGNSYTHYEFTTEQVLSPKYQKLLEVLKKNETVYIKPDAFTWQPLDARNATITVTDENGNEITVSLDDYIDQKKQEYEQARKLLIIAGGAALL